MRKTVEPTVTPNDGPLGGTVIDHPAFGQIAVFKVSGQRTLYGSDFVHDHYVSLCVYESQTKRSLARDWYSQTKEIMRLDMSEAQWATLVSSFGIAEGVPCTLNFANGTLRPQFPLRDSGQEYKIEASKVLDDSVKRLKELREKVAANVQGLSKTRQEDILKHVEKAISDLTSSLPFVVDSFSEHMEERVEKAKVEVSSYLSNAVTRAGLESLVGKPPLLLSGRNEHESTIENGDN